MCRGNYGASGVGSVVRLQFAIGAIGGVKTERDEDTAAKIFGESFGCLPAIPKTPLPVSVVSRPDEELAVAELRTALEATVCDLDDGEPIAEAHAEVSLPPVASCWKKSARRASLPGPSRVPLLVPVTSSRPASPVLVRHRGPARPNTPVHARLCPLPPREPLDKAASAPSTAAHVHLLCDCELHLLVADDEPLNRMLAGRVFSSFCPCSKVDVVSHGKAAVDAFEAAEAAGHPYDAAVLDIEMPCCSGLDAAREIRRFERLEGHARPARLVAWSSLVGRCGEARDECLEAGFDGALSKPCPPASLFAGALSGLRHRPGCPCAASSSSPAPNCKGRLAPLASIASSPALRC